LVAVIACALTACSSVKVLPPRHAPAQAMPAVAMPATPVPAGHGRVVIDTSDGPMDVVAQTTASFTSNVAPRSGFLCRTPCVVDLPLGSYTLYFSGLAKESARGDVARLDVREGINVLRRAPGKYEPPEEGSDFGVVLFVTGISALSLGVALAAISDEPVPGIAVATLGAGVTVGGIALMPGKRAEQQEGATTTWNVPSPSQPPAPQPVLPQQPDAEAEAPTPTDGSTTP
jgi:hypothetical protein